jgi:hypothetical protein
MLAAIFIVALVGAVLASGPIVRLALGGCLFAVPIAVAHGDFGTALVAAGFIAAYILWGAWSEAQR